MRPVLSLLLAAMAVAGHCDRAAPPPPAPFSVVYFDSGAQMRAHMKDGTVITGRLLTTFAPGGNEFVICAERRDPCARTLPIDSIVRVRAHETAAFVGADLGWRVGLLAGAATVDKKKPNGEKKTRQEIEDETIGPALLGALVGGGLGALIGSRINVWPTLAERADASHLQWLAGQPVLIAPKPHRGRFLTSCTRGDTLPNGRLVAVVDWGNDAYSIDALRAWQLDSSATRIVPTSPIGVRCRNPYSQTPEPPVAYEREAAALSFKPAPGQARIYVAQTAAMGLRRDTVFGFRIAIDGRIVARTVSGTYLMEEVAPGRHTVTVVGELTSAVTLETQADSTYFVQLSHKMGLKGPKFGRLEQVGRSYGGRLVRSGHIVPQAFVDGPITVERVRGGISIHNGSADPVRYFVVADAAAAPSDSAACASMQCPELPGYWTIIVRDERILGFDPTVRESGEKAIVYVWHDGVKRLVVPL